MTPEERRSWGRSNYAANRVRFHKQRREYYQQNAVKIKAARLAYYHRNKEMVGLRARCKRYGITVADMDRLMSFQEGRCAICPSDIRSDFHVDHDHATGQVRGLLCQRCNLAIGNFAEDTDLLWSAIAYLERPEWARLTGETLVPLPPLRIVPDQTSLLEAMEAG